MPGFFWAVYDHLVERGAKARAGFPTTRWSAVEGMRSGVETERRRSWDAIVDGYRAPICEYLRLRWRREAADAEDLAQSFFAWAITEDIFASYDSERARFRTFVRLCLDRFVMNEDKAGARLKRGGGALHAPLEAAEGVVAGSPSPETLFERAWQRSLVARAVEALRAHCDEGDKRSHFSLFERYDLADPDERPTYRALAEESGLPVTTVTMRLAYARRELRRLLLADLEGLTASHDELRHEARLVLGVSIE